MAAPNEAPPNMELIQAHGINSWERSVELIMIALEKGNEKAKGVARKELRRLAMLADEFKLGGKDGKAKIK